MSGPLGPHCSDNLCRYQMYNLYLGLNEAQFEPEQETKLRTAQFHIQYIPIQVVKLQHKYKNKDHFNEIRPDYSCDPSTK